MTKQGTLEPEMRASILAVPEPAYLPYAAAEYAAPRLDDDARAHVDAFAGRLLRVQHADAFLALCAGHA